MICVQVAHRLKPRDISHNILRDFQNPTKVGDTSAGLCDDEVLRPEKPESTTDMNRRDDIIETANSVIHQAGLSRHFHTPDCCWLRGVGNRDLCPNSENGITELLQNHSGHYMPDFDES